ncbi:MAG TPA: porin [Gemmatimonadales bacterium]|nr:porin [Gemmatimonadales bacterium]
MSLLVRRAMPGLVLGVIGAIGSASAQTTYPNVKVTGRLQEQFYVFDNEPYAATVGSESNFFTRRARIEARGQISENVTLYIQPSFEGGRNLSNVVTTCSGTPLVCRTTGRSGLRLRDAWIDVRFSPEASKGGLYLRAGQEKRPYSRYELTSSNNLVSIERGAGQGLLPRASNDLFSSNGFLSHDVGASIRYEYKLDDLRLVTLKFGAYNGQGESLNDVNNTKSLGARVTAGIWSKLDIGGSWFSHDGIVTVGSIPDSAFTNYAWGVDAQWGKPGDEGLYVLGEYLDGNDATATKNKIRGVQGLAAYNYRFKSPTSWLYAIEPAFRVDLADPNTALESDRATLITAVLGIYMSSKAQLRVAYERQSFQDDITPAISGLRSALTVNF